MARPVVLVLVLALAAAGCAGADQVPEPASGRDSGTAATPSPERPAVAGPAHGGTRGPVVPDGVSVVTTGLAAPWGLTFLPDGSALVSERDSGRLVAVGVDGATRQVGVLDGLATDGEGGLLGLEVSGGRTVFAYLTTPQDNRVVRMTYDGDALGQPEPILTGIPRATIHDGGQLRLGPDGMLYVSTGDAGDPALAPDVDSLGGKILRIHRDGRVPADNPFPGSPVYSLGHRNVQGLDFDDDGRLWASEFGQSSWDEINLITAGADYGWPRFEGMSDGSDPSVVDPVVVWPTDQASPSGLAYMRETIFVAALRGERLWQVPLERAGGTQASKPQAAHPTAGDPTSFFDGELGRLRAARAAPDGTLWVLTNNTDGRGIPGDQDDKLISVRVSRAT